MLKFAAAESAARYDRTATSRASSRSTRRAAARSRRAAGRSASRCSDRRRVRGRRTRRRRRRARGRAARPGATPPSPRCRPAARAAGSSAVIGRSVPLTSGVCELRLTRCWTGATTETVSSWMTESRASAIEHLLVGQSLDLELAEDVADEREAHDVVAGSAGERDLVAALVARAGLARDVARDRRRGDADAGERQPLGVGDSPADDVGLGPNRSSGDREREARRACASRHVQRKHSEEAGGAGRGPGGRLQCERRITCSTADCRAPFELR